MNFRNLILAYTMFLQSCLTPVLAGLPPTTSGGQSGTATTTFNFKAPLNQFTKTGATTGLVETGNYNLLADPGMESSDTNSWVAVGGSGMTISKSTTAANVAFGNQGLLTSGPGSNAAVRSIGIVVPNGLDGQNGYARCLVKDGNTSGNFLYVSTSTTATTSQIAIGTVNYGTQFVPVEVNFVFPAAGTTIYLWIDQGSNGIKIDDCYLGAAKNVSPSTTTAWTSFTPTGSWVSNTTYTGQWRCVADTYEWRVRLALAGAPTSATLTINYLAPGISIDSTKFNGTSAPKAQAWGITRSAGSDYDLLGNYNSSSSVVAVVKNATSTYTSASSSVTQAVPGTYANGDSVELTGSVPALGCPSSNAVVLNNTPSFWSGYHDSTCAWARTNASYGDPTADTTCALTQRQNYNFGSVTSALSGSDKLPGIVFTPVVAGYYRVCANASVAGGTLASTVGVQLIDNASTQQSEFIATTQVASDFESMPNCAIVQATSTASQTIKLQTKASSGSVTIGSGSGSAIEWTIVQISPNANAPILVGSVTSNSTGAERIERVSVAASCTSTPCTIASQSGAWVSSITRSSTGVYVVNFTAGMWSAAPSCVYRCTNGSNVMFGDGAGAAESTSSVSIQCFNSSAAATDAGFRLICMGPR